ncbi:hypothetical protein [Bradyrhizobium amphicarpaeae]|uniref:hypothetical protein n=1 Tax=Bradyrhizobium amphicarpaeae TaxID=1404768 RepID=UPI00187506D9|nr:hypothetical protein [Bradyrhizobium amphicarpaeae]
MWRLLAALILGIQVSSVSAQLLPLPIPGPPATTAEPTPQEVEASANELSKQPVPDKDALLLRELDRLDAEISRATQQFQRANSFKNQQSVMAAAGDRLMAQAKVLSQFDCANNIAKFPQALNSYFRAFGELTTVAASSSLGNLDFTPFFFQNDPNPATSCAEAKTKFGSSDYLEAQAQVLSGTQKALADFVAAQTNLANAETRYLEALKKRRASVQDKLNASQPAAQIGSNLWLLLLILAIACVATILGIKLFEPELQMEWVASGQVIQFVTVMILLSVILALGLSGKLLENTLGTLLGGIAGYVLAQGVGRSAARNVANAAAAASVPAPPAPPSPAPAAARVPPAPPAPLPPAPAAP